MQPSKEIITPDLNSSFKLAKYTSWEKTQIPNWHLHPEYELVYVEKGQGYMHIGNHRSRYENGILILLGPNLPHTNFGNRMEGNLEIVAQFDLRTMGINLLHMPEMRSTQALLEQAKHGLIFPSVIQKEIGKQLKGMFDLDSFQRMIQLLDILNTLSQCAQYEILNTGSLIVKEIDYGRINTVYRYVNDHHKEIIDLSLIASQVNLTVPAFCRFFKKTTGKTFNQFLTEFRVSLACQLLAEKSKSILEISLACGFRDISNFNRQFKKLTHSTPSDYRRSLTNEIEND